MQTEAYLNVTAENLDDLHELGIDAELNDELPCVVQYEVLGADPNCGIMGDDVDIRSATFNQQDVLDLFDMDRLREEVLTDYKEMVAGWTSHNRSVLN